MILQAGHLWDGGAWTGRKHRLAVRSEPGARSAMIKQLLSDPTVLSCFLGVYLGVMLLVCVYGLHRYQLVHLYYKYRKNTPKVRACFLTLPRVTIQLPMFNEQAVAARIIDATCRIDYPLDRLQIQVLDDSTDATVEVAQAAVARGGVGWIVPVCRGAANLSWPGSCGSRTGGRLLRGSARCSARPVRIECRLGRDDGAECAQQRQAEEGRQVPAPKRHVAQELELRCRELGQS